MDPQRLAHPLALPDAPVTRPWRCPACERPTEPYGRACATCLPGEQRLVRRATLQAAWDSLPASHRGLDLGHPELAARIAYPELIAPAAEHLHELRVVAYGRAGAGKTSLLTAMAATLLRRAEEPGCTVEAFRRARGLRFVSAFDLSQARSNSALGAEAQLVQEALRATVLILDDLGIEPMTASSAVAHVIHRRYMDQRDTWTTTGVPSKELEARYGTGTMRRILEGAKYLAFADKKERAA